VNFNKNRARIFWQNLKELDSKIHKRAKNRKITKDSRADKIKGTAKRTARAKHERGSLSRAQPAAHIIKSFKMLLLNNLNTLNPLRSPKNAY
jgi:hypothetical protein